MAGTLLKVALGLLGLGLVGVFGLFFAASLAMWKNARSLERDEALREVPSARMPPDAATPEAVALERRPR